MRISNPRLSLISGLLLLSTCVCLTSCKNDGFKNGCLQFVDKEMERYVISRWDTDHDTCISQTEASSIDRVFAPKWGEGKICDQYGIETLDDITHFSQVNELGSYAFEGCKSLRSAHLPNIKAIGEGTFSGCSNLQEVKFDNLHSINRAAFADCTSLTSVNFPNVKFVGPSSFYGCNHLKEIRLPNAWDIPNNLEDYYWRSTVASRAGNDPNGRIEIFIASNYYITNSPVLEKLVLSSSHPLGCGDMKSPDTASSNCKLLIDPLKGDLSKKVTLVLNESQKPNVTFENGVPIGWARTFWKEIIFVK